MPGATAAAQMPVRGQASPYPASAQTPRTPASSGASGLAAVLADPGQAAARQDSIVPLLARLAALGRQLQQLPAPAAQAALRLLDARLDLGTTSPDGKALRAAMAEAGVFARPGGPSQSDQRSLLLQLRGGLSGVPGAEVEPVAPIAGRAAPPLRGDDARAVRGELPMPPEPDAPLRGLAAHADAALARTRLLQHASQPAETRPGSPVQQAEWRIEVPVVLGAETSLIQFVIDREARRRDRPAERGWRMRFALGLSATGDVGAEVALFGSSVSVALWADRGDTETALAESLAELRDALAAEGLTTASLSVRRRPRGAAAWPGALMDASR